MNFFHRWCARVAKNQQDAIHNEIKLHTRDLEHAIVCEALCYKVNAVANKYRGINAPTPTVFSPEDIDALVSFVHLRLDAHTPLEWLAVKEKHRKWFIDRGLPVPTTP